MTGISNVMEGKRARIGSKMVRRFEYQVPLVMVW